MIRFLMVSPYQTVCPVLQGIRDTKSLRGDHSVQSRADLSSPDPGTPTPRAFAPQHSADELRPSNPMPSLERVPLMSSPDTVARRTTLVSLVYLSRCCG